MWWRFIQSNRVNTRTHYGRMDRWWTDRGCYESDDNSSFWVFGLGEPYYSKTSKTWMPMSHLPWLIWTPFGVPWNSYNSSRKQIFKGILAKFILPLFYRRLIKLSPFASWRYDWTLSGSSYSCLEQISMVPKMFKLLKFDYKKPKDCSST